MVAQSLCPFLGLRPQGLVPNITDFMKFKRKNFKTRGKTVAGVDRRSISNQAVDTVEGWQQEGCGGKKIAAI